MSSAAVGVAAGALVVSPALANGHGDDRRSERGQGAPGQVCKQQGHQPGTEAFRTCVVALAQQRGQGQQTQEQRQQAKQQREQAKQQRRQAREQAKQQRRQAREQAKQQRRQAREQAKEQRRQAREQARQQRRQARQQQRQQNNASARGQGAPGRVCQQQGHEPGSEAFRTCVTTLAKQRGQGQGRRP